MQSINLSWAYINLFDKTPPIIIFSKLNIRLQDEPYPFDLHPRTGAESQATAVLLGGRFPTAGETLIP